MLFCSYCDPAGARTQDPNIKSVMLYQLSYGILSILLNLRLSPIEGTKVACYEK